MDEEQPWAAWPPGLRRFLGRLTRALRDMWHYLHNARNQIRRMNLENRRTQQQIRGIQRDVTRINDQLDGLNERLNALERQVQLLIRAAGNSYLGAIEDELLDLAGY